MSQTSEETLSEAFGALSDPHRLRALRYIADREPPGGSPAGECGEAVCACHVESHLDLSQPATSYHLKVLREAGLVTAEKRGRWVHYRIAEDRIERLRDFLDELSERTPVAGAGAS